MGLIVIEDCCERAQICEYPLRIFHYCVMFWTGNSWRSEDFRKGGSEAQLPNHYSDGILSVSPGFFLRNKGEQRVGGVRSPPAGSKKENTMENTLENNWEKD